MPSWAKTNKFEHPPTEHFVFILVIFMPQPFFVHLRVHTEFSVVDGIVRIPDLIAAAAADQQGALGISDLSNLFATVKFYSGALKQGIKPIIGADVWVRSEDQRVTRALLLVQNNQGYQSLNSLLSRAWLTNQEHGRAIVEFSWFAQAQGLIALSGAQSGEIGCALVDGRHKDAERALQRWTAAFPNRFYVELQRAGAADEAAYLAAVLPLAQQHQVPVVATHPIQFIAPDDFRAHEARVCIAQGELLNNNKRARVFTNSQYFMTQSQMMTLFADIPSAISNSVEIAKRCNLTLTLGQPQLPDFPTPNGFSVNDFFVQEAQLGLKRRLETLYPDPKTRAAETPRYEERLAFECETITKMKFAGYFLIVADFIGWSKKNGIPVGPGRGSGAGSLVAYVLSITDLDPLKYQLLFERFLNPERQSMPDFDIDFCQLGRDRVIEYVRQKYGRDAVSQIATFGTMAAKGALRDVGRALEHSYSFCEGLSKLIPQQVGISLAQALIDEPELQKQFDENEEVSALVTLAQEVEGIVRNVGMHAGGVLIAPVPLDHFCPRYRQAKGEDEGVIAQFDKDDVESIGLVKFDFLGLTTLTILNQCLQDIASLTQVDIDLAGIPLDDKGVFKNLSRAQTVAVFQLESRGMQGMLKEALPDRFEDIIALVALFRPGPMAFIPDYCRRKKGEPFDYPDPRTEAILKETYGIMVYQEQVMQMAQIVAGYSLAEADLLRRTMGKKDEVEMSKQRAVFCARATNNGLSDLKANEIFDLIFKFAGYGFNKSHAAAYALLAYQTAWLKHYYPAIFMAANLTLAMDDTDSIKVLIQDARTVCGVTLLPPDINISDYRFLPQKESDGRIKSIRYGLGAIKGLGRSAIEALVDARNGVGVGGGVDGLMAAGPFTDLFDFCARVDKQRVKKRAIEALIRAGAFDSLYPNGAAARSTLLNSVGSAYEWAEAQAANALQVGLFDDASDSSIDPIELVPMEPWAIAQQLAEEKLALGFFLSGYLFQQYETEWRHINSKRLADLSAQKNIQNIAGVVKEVRRIQTQRGLMNIAVIDDGSKEIEFRIDERFLSEIKLDQFIALEGKVVEDRYKGGLSIQVNEIYRLDQIRTKHAQYIQLALRKHISSTQLKETLRPFLDPQGLALNLDLTLSSDAGDIQYHANLSSVWRVRPTEECLTALDTACGHAKIVY